MLINFLLAFSFSTAAPSQGQDTVPDVEPLLRERIQVSSHLKLDEVWSASQAIEESAGEKGRTALDASVDKILGSSESLPERGVLMLASVRLAGSEPDVQKLSARLGNLLESKDEDVARGAAGLLSDKKFKTLKDDDKAALTKQIKTAMTDGNRGPDVRLAGAVALHVIGGGADQRDARSLMLEFLGSSDAHLRGLGALSLARVGDVETGRDELNRLAAVPDLDGALADAYLKQEDIRRYYDRRTRNTLDYAKKQVESTELKGNHDLAMIESTIRLIQQTSLEADKPVAKRENLIYAALDGMMRSLDEHSSFLTPEAFKKTFDQDLLNPEYGGIGAYVIEDRDDHLFTIRQPIYSGPAYKKGLRSGDKIVRIDDWPTLTPKGMRQIDEIIKKLKGKPGTKVKLYVWHHGMDPTLIDRPTEEMAVEIVREEVTIPPVNADFLPGGIAYIELTTFSKVASEAIIQKLAEYKDKGMRAVILDLRENTGGLLTEARNVANLFLPPKKLVVTTESRIEEPEKLYTRTQPLVPMDMPVYVLVGPYSASASEIVAGALQDYQRATLVGQRTYGKGSVQQLIQIPGEKNDEFTDENHNGRYDAGEPLTQDYNGNGEFDFAPRARMTVARWLLPSGRSIHREFDEDGKILSEGGVQPEVDVKPRRFEAWQNEEVRRLRGLDPKGPDRFHDYLDQNYPANRQLFNQLAQSDDLDFARYPGFEAFYQSLETPLTRQDVRLVLRSELRARAQDDRGSTFPSGDFEEDLVLQAAIKRALEKLGSSVNDVDVYAKTFEKGRKEQDRPLTANLSDSMRTDLRRALTLVDQAKSGAPISAERLAEIEKALQSVLDK